MKNRTLVEEIMNRDVMALNMNDTVREAENTFRNHFLRHAPVMANGELVGMLSLVDMKTRTGLEDTQTTSSGSGILPLMVRDVMTPDPVSVQASATVVEAARLFAENEFHALPVLDGDRIAGIISTTDVIRHFLEEME
ncbi:MAG: CBS domain-containing protein [Bacteroidota bacterium]